ncbi:MAG: hypothetical protein AAF191_11220 [Verrucomicrobiota bacterium]
MKKLVTGIPLFIFAYAAYLIIGLSSPTTFCPQEVEVTTTTLAPSSTPADSDTPEEVTEATPSQASTTSTELKMPRPVLTVPLPSKGIWYPTVSDFFIMASVFILLIELAKSTKTGNATTIEHAFSLIVFIVFLLTFLMLPVAGTSTFLILTLFSLLDVVAGFTITISTARRDFGMGAHGVAHE